MKNPWAKKNPFMSMWLSGGYKVGGAARGQATAAIRRELRNASMNATAAANQQIFDFWNAALGVAPKSRRRKRR